MVAILLLIQIESRKLEWKAQSKVGSMDNAKHKPTGGEKKVRPVRVIDHTVSLLVSVHGPFMFTCSVLCNTYGNVK